jgi:sugar O-acyltransferase (sialic acid O-acetyltransferase NeuD family)
VNRTLLIWGAGGHGKVVLDVALSSGHLQPIVFVDDDPERAGKSFCGFALVTGSGNLERFRGALFMAAVGDNRLRARCFARAVAAGLVPATLIHLSAVVSPSADLGTGTVVMPGAVVNAGVMTGMNGIVNSGAIIEHDCILGNHVHIAPRATLGGNVLVGDFAHVGLGAAVLPSATVGAGCVVGAGAVVLRDVPTNSTVVGVPARVLKYA